MRHTLEKVCRQTKYLKCRFQLLILANEAPLLLKIGYNPAFNFIKNLNMPILSFKNITYSVGEFPLLDHVNLSMDANEKIALIGRNGEGKSTLLKILSGHIQAEDGSIEKAPHLKIARLEQDLPDDSSITVYEAVAAGLSDLSDLLIQYHELTHQEDNHDDKWLQQLTRLQEAIEQRNGWHIQQRIERILLELSLPEDSPLSSLSGGWKRRVSLGAALVQEPDILLLDEPTNHLDLDAITWLEEMLSNYPKTIIFITHDRSLLRKLATRILEIDRGKLTSYPPDYDGYLARKQQALMEEERHNALFDKKLSEEEVWIRQGVKARRTRNEGRVRALEKLREERKQRQVLQDKPAFQTNTVAQSGKLVVQAENVTFGYTPDKLLIKDFSFNIQRGDKVAIVGGNGAGKTTLIKLLLGQLEPLSGNVKQSPKNQPAFFDQSRAAIDPTATCMDNVAEGDDSIEIQGRSKHVIGYLAEFLFSPKKCRTLAGVLSGGEQNRLLLAKLFSKVANILVLDEPTNDLDIESLDILEERLLNYPGTVILISHDREFIDNIATHCIGFEVDGSISVQVGGYSDWIKRKKTLPKAKKPPTKPKSSVDDGVSKKSQQEERELKALPGKIEGLEKSIKALHDEMGKPGFYEKPTQQVEKTQQKLKKFEDELATLYERWEALE